MAVFCTFEVRSILRVPAPPVTVKVGTAATVQTKGPYEQENWISDVTNTSGQGHIPDINFWIRSQEATYRTGVSQTYTITTNVGTPDNVFISTGTGTVLHLHEENVSAFANADDYYVINDSGTPYTIVNDLNALLTDSTGASMSGRYFSLVLWICVSSEGEEKRFINLPSGSYPNQTDLEEDLNNYSTYTIPTEFKNTSILDRS